MSCTTIKEFVEKKDIAELKKMSNEQNIICVCYYSAISFTSRAEALNYWKSGFYGSEGSERDRYSNLFFALLDGATFAVDDEYFYR